MSIQITSTCRGVTTYREVNDPEILARYDRAVSGGGTAIVELLPGGVRVRKAVIPTKEGWGRKDCIAEMRREIAIYKVLPKGHPRILEMLDSYDTGNDAGIELAYMPHGSLRAYLADNNAAIDARQRARWVLEAADGVVMLHAHGVLHSDLKPENMVVDQQLGVRIIDLSGSALGDQPALCLESTRYYLPRGRKDGASVAADLFALGSSIYHIVTGAPPYEHRDDKDVEDCFARREFPALDNTILFAGTVRRCWHLEFASAVDAFEALKVETRTAFGSEDRAFIETASGISLSVPSAGEKE